MAEVGILPDLHTKHGRLWHGDCLQLMRRIPDGKIDMLFVDLPYGTTAAAWDSIIPLDALWLEYNRVCKPNAAMVFTCAQPFTTTLIASNRKHFKYCWYWVKNRKTSFASAKYQPMRNVEEVAVFYRETPTYHPQGLTRIPAQEVRTHSRMADKDSAYGIRQLSNKYTSEFTNFPHQTLMFDSPTDHLHATQKPVPLVQYMLRTYTDPGQIVLDNTCGSGTTAVAAILTGRKYVCIEQDPAIFETARQRIVGTSPGFIIA